MYTIFLVEDEAVIRTGLKQLIEEVIGGFRVAGEAGNGREALDTLASMPMPDLLMTDIRMNEMNGIEMIGRIRGMYPALPILILSGYAEFEYAKQALRYGISDYLLKPVDRVELTQVLNRIKRELAVRSGAAEGEGAGEDAQSGRMLIRKVKELVAERLDQEISLPYLADQVHLNPQYLSALFKSETGQNFSDYVLQCRMNRAKQLLKETHLRIYEVASLSGYASAKHFMAVFKDAVGLTPTQYRDRSGTG